MKIGLSKKMQKITACLILVVIFVLCQNVVAVELSVNAPDIPPLTDQIINEATPPVEQSVIEVTSVLPSQSTDDAISDGLKFGDLLNLSSTDPRIIAAKIINLALGLVGIIFVLLILLGGARFMFSGGNKEKVSEAKKTLFNAIIGLIIIFTAYSIVNFVISGLITSTE